MLYYFPLYWHYLAAFCLLFYIILMNNEWLPYNNCNWICHWRRLTWCHNKLDCTEDSISASAADNVITDVNGSLTIRRVDKMNEGVYVLQASNAFGRVVSPGITLRLAGSIIVVSVNRYTTTFLLINLFILRGLVTKITYHFTLSPREHCLCVCSHTCCVQHSKNKMTSVLLINFYRAMLCLAWIMPSQNVCPSAHPLVCLSVCLSVWHTPGILSKQLNTSSNFISPKCGLSNGPIFNDLERPVTKISRTRHYLTLSISETVPDIDILQWNTNKNLRPPKVWFRMTLSDLGKHLMTRSIARSFCRRWTSWQSCLINVLNMPTFL